MMSPILSFDALAFGAIASDTDYGMQEWIGGTSKSMRWHLVGIVLALLSGLDARQTGNAQPYCAVYSDGPPNCGIPTLQSCEQSILGVGGMCQPDNTAQRQPNLLGDGRLLREFQGRPAPATQDGSPNNPNWMPPPPGE
jgi:hypothetical protein